MLPCAGCESTESGALTILPLAHTEHVDAPVALLYVPGGHGRHDVKLENENCPGKHAATVSGELHAEPAGQMSGALRRDALQNVPLAHGMADTEPGGQYSPAAQRPDGSISAAARQK